MSRKLSIAPGKIYILRNTAFRETLVKIGRTKSSSEIRAQSISSVTGVPLPFEVLYEEDVIDCVMAEKLVHDLLKVFRVNSRREFFKVELKTAVKAVFDVCLSVNKAISDERARLVICLPADGFNPRESAAYLQAALEPYRGGSTRVFLLYENARVQAQLPLSESYDVDCKPALLATLQRANWVRDFFVSVPDEDPFGSDIPY